MCFVDLLSFWGCVLGGALRVLLIYVCNGCFVSMLRKVIGLSGEWEKCVAGEL